MAHNMKSSIIFIILVQGMILLGQASESTGATAVNKLCPLFCLRVEYMTCPSSGDKKLPAQCNCCLTVASKGCTLHITDGPLLHCN
ncbi:hypothetical protein AKJ16_DCAP16975 [Drosera capensis]